MNSKLTIRGVEQETLTVLLERCLATKGRRAAKQIVSVGQLKQILADKGFIDPFDGEPTDDCTPELKTAIRKFQELHWEAHPFSCKAGCDLCDGIVGAETERNLLDDTLEASPGCEEDRPTQIAKTHGKSDLKDMIVAAAIKHGVPPYIALATAQAESGIKALRPTGSREGQTFYPMGLQLNRGRFIANRVLKLDLTDEEIIELLLNPATQIELAVADLARGWRRHRKDPFGNPDEAMRVFWTMPKYAKMRANGDPSWSERGSGSVPWSRRLSRWKKIVDRYKAIAE